MAHTDIVIVDGDDANRAALTDTRALRGFQVRHWTRDGMAFWAVSDLNEIELDQFVRGLYS